MRKLILNSGGMGANPAGIAAVATHFAGCTNVVVLHYAHLDGAESALKVLKTLIPGVAFTRIDIEKDHASALKKADGIWAMGGNSFVFADQLAVRNLLDPVREMVQRGIPYAGASAGANMAGPTICTTNDKPILRYQRSLDGFNLVPFQINPHYLDGKLLPDYRGETMEMRIREFHQINDVPVVGLPEGTWLVVDGNAMRLEGADAFVFERDKPKRVVPAGSDMSPLLKATPRFNVPTVSGLDLL